MKKEYKLPITFACNWKCSYCCVDTHNQKEVMLDDIYKTIEQYPLESVVHIEGGEPGLVSKDIIYSIIDKLINKKCDLILNTNGTFLKKYPELLYQFSTIVYHCIENVTLRNKIEEYDYNNLTYMLVFDKTEQLSDIIYYIENYPHITFFIAWDIKTQLSIKREILHFLSKYRNRITKDSITYLLNPGDRI